MKGNLSPHNRTALMSIISDPRLLKDITFIIKNMLTIFILYEDILKNCK